MSASSSPGESEDPPDTTVTVQIVLEESGSDRDVYVFLDSERPAYCAAHALPGDLSEAAARRRAVELVAEAFEVIDPSRDLEWAELHHTRRCTHTVTAEVQVRGPVPLGRTPHEPFVEARAPLR